MAQLAGGFPGALLILATFAGAADMGTGSTALADGVSFGRGVVAEAVATFLLVTASMALAVDRRAPGGWAGLMIGLSVTCAIIVYGPVTGASLNPARSFGPVLATALGGGDAAWGNFPGYILGPRSAARPRHSLTTRSPVRGWWRWSRHKGPRATCVRGG